MRVQKDEERTLIGRRERQKQRGNPIDREILTLVDDNRVEPMTVLLQGPEQRVGRLVSPPLVGNYLWRLLSGSAHFGEAQGVEMTHGHVGLLLECMRRHCGE